jgi:hypothetical protein
MTAGNIAPTRPPAAAPAVLAPSAFGGAFTLPATPVAPVPAPAVPAPPAAQASTPAQLAASTTSTLGGSLGAPYVAPVLPAPVTPSSFSRNVASAPVHYNFDQTYDVKVPTQNFSSTPWTQPVADKVKPPEPKGFFGDVVEGVKLGALGSLGTAGGMALNATAKGVAGYENDVVDVNPDNLTQGIVQGVTSLAVSTIASGTPVGVAIDVSDVGIGATLVQTGIRELFQGRTAAGAGNLAAGTITAIGGVVGLVPLFGDGAKAILNSAKKPLIRLAESSTPAAFAHLSNAWNAVADQAGKIFPQVGKAGTEAIEETTEAAGGALSSPVQEPVSVGAGSGATGSGADVAETSMSSPSGGSIADLNPKVGEDGKVYLPSGQSLTPAYYSAEFAGTTGYTSLTSAPAKEKSLIEHLVPETSKTRFAGLIREQTASMYGKRLERLTEKLGHEPTLTQFKADLAGFSPARRLSLSVHEGIENVAAGIAKWSKGNWTGQLATGIHEKWIGVHDVFIQTPQLIANSQVMKAPVIKPLANVAGGIVETGLQGLDLAGAGLQYAFAVTRGIRNTVSIGSFGTAAASTAVLGGAAMTGNVTYSHVEGKAEPDTAQGRLANKFASVNTGESYNTYSVLVGNPRGFYVVAGVNKVTTDPKILSASPDMFSWENIKKNFLPTNPATGEFSSVGGVVNSSRATETGDRRDFFGGPGYGESWNVRLRGTGTLGYGFKNADIGGGVFNIYSMRALGATRFVSTLEAGPVRVSNTEQNLFGLGKLGMWGNHTLETVGPLLSAASHYSFWNLGFNKNYKQEIRKTLLELTSPPPPAPSYSVEIGDKRGIYSLWDTWNDVDNTVDETYPEWESYKEAAVKQNNLVDANSLNLGQEITISPYMPETEPDFVLDWKQPR